MARSVATFNATSGGLGARAGRDGVSCLAFPANVANMPVGVLESEVPVLCEERSLWVDSAGPPTLPRRVRPGVRAPRAPGRSRPDGPVALGCRGGRFRHPVPGLLGGGPRPNGELLVNGHLQISGRHLRLGPAETIMCRIPGGGGIGDPRTRERALITRDLADGLITEEHARAVYGYEPSGGEPGERWRVVVAMVGTKARGGAWAARTTCRRARRERGRPSPSRGCLMKLFGQKYQVAGPCTSREAMRQLPAGQASRRT